MSIRMGGRNGGKKRFRKQTQTALFKRKRFVASLEKIQR